MFYQAGTSGGHYLMQNMSQAQKDLVDSGQRGSMFEVYFRHNKA